LASGEGVAAVLVGPPTASLAAAIAAFGEPPGCAGRQVRPHEAAGTIVARPREQV
jgi:hypothetical protein